MSIGLSDLPLTKDIRECSTCGKIIDTFVADDKGRCIRCQVNADDFEPEDQELINVVEDFEKLSGEK